MRIGIDARTILNPAKGEAAGTGHYTYQLIRNLLDIDSGNQYVLFFDWRARHRDMEKFSRENVKICYFPFSHYKKYLPIAYMHLLTSVVLAREKLDVYHSPAGSVPLSYSGKTVVTIDNLAIFKHPDLFPKYERVRARMRPYIARKADAIIAVTEATKKDIMDVHAISEEKITVISHGLDKRFFEGCQEKEADDILQTYAIVTPYLFFLGTLEPTKNLSRLLEGFARAKDHQGLRDLKLVIGGKDGWMADEYRRFINDHQLKDDVQFIGYVPPDHLNALFHRAHAFVFPSIYESFGMVILEAMANKTPVLISNTTSLVETACACAHTVDPYDVAAITQGIIAICTNNTLRDALIVNGYERAKKFDWKETARKTLEMYQSVGGRK
ncbi:MAG: hypothetical protein COT39_04260 [Parcubacteria group bacterium CG08_land_8_20_14_0_20_48_21]|nr:MAG: hypothetical protein AUK21_02470 [Parcubacteria group bacterium CG2_30_48_51]PIS32488.1 MAG: hypothetical protein COT39_04260 [Parcubacteria group bacterium CG08_land_8_20_14_0_20_48_21]PIW78836.1 MAG: hypothetical protein COZ99_04330 [Parcubacteria group bacterium CG_4_8_14_3_um_filter_48_16]PIY78009.1 MAG: hypothetical protein COY83_02210 [Parcubacteria group bacterium CG_4_10_14_0_8_um_filter_48_154]PIZ77126.1 MAG: hypothetical protein COY03_03940 [bacterium CG_4_10_14_0_2_um_filter_